MRETHAKFFFTYSISFYFDVLIDVAVVVS